MKIAVAGKGGVGKTLIAGTLARLLAREGYRVLAIDADPAMSLSYALGIPFEVSSRLTPIAENKSLIEERTGAKPGSAWNIFFSLTPTVDDIAEKYGVVGPDGVRFLLMGTVRSGGSGCTCPANSLLSVLIRHLTLRREDAVIMDMEAGLEHLGRATARGFDMMLCVAEPNAPSIETALRIERLAREIGIKETVFIGNKIADKEDEEYIRKVLEEAGFSLYHTVPFDRNVVKSGITRIAPIDYSPSSPAIIAIKDLKEKLLRDHC